MNTLQDKIVDLFSNHKLLKNIRTGLVVFALIVIPIVWFGFRDTFTFAALFSWEFGSVIFIITLSIILATWETKSLAYDITVETDENDEIRTLEKDIDKNATEIRKLDKNGKLSVVWVNEHNKEQQQLYDEIKTNDRIELCEKRVLQYRINGKEKRAKWYEAEIKRLKSNGLHDKNFVPYNVKRLMAVESIGIKLPKKKGDTEISANPKQINWIAILLGMPVRALGVGVLGTIPFIINADPASIFWFYIGYLVTLGITIISQYLITAHKTMYGYKTSLKKIIKLQELLLDYLSKEETE